MRFKPRFFPKPPPRALVKERKFVLHLKSYIDLDSPSERIQGVYITRTAVKIYALFEMAIDTSSQFICVLHFLSYTLDPFPVIFQLIVFVQIFTLL